MRAVLPNWRKFVLVLLILFLVNPRAMAQQKSANNHPMVVFLGDSIIANWREKFFSENGYVARGVSGEQSAGMLNRFHRDVVSLEPTAVFILAGANDVSGWGGQVTDEQLIANLQAMVKLARANRIKVVIGSVTPSLPYSWNPNVRPAPRIAALDKKIMEWAQAEGIGYADFWSALSLPNGDMNPEYGDQHPNNTGYAVMEPIAKAAVEKALTTQP